MEGQEGAEVGCIGFGQAFAHVVADDFGIAHDHGAVEGIVLAAFAGAVLDARIEDAVDALFQEVLDVAVDQFGRVAGRVRRDRVHGLFKQGLRRRVREDDGVAEFGEEREPEGIVFVHIEDPRDTDGAARRIFYGLVAEEQVIFDLVHVGQRLLAGCCRAGGTAFAAVARDEGTAVVEGVDRQQAVVGAQAAVADGRRDLQFFQGFRADDGRFCMVFVVGRAADEAHAEGPHEAGNGRADDVAA